MRSATKKHTGKDEAYLEYIRSLPCTICAEGLDPQPSITESAHTGPHGLSQKSADRTAIPLCAQHHREGGASLHKLGGRFWVVHNIDRDELIADLNLAYEAQNYSAQNAGGTAA
jgi:hypothetical protein